jgi:hypothetical protein
MEENLLTEEKRIILPAKNSWDHSIFIDFVDYQEAL